MKNASRIFYLIGFVTNIIGVIVLAFLLLGLGLLLSSPESLLKVADEMKVTVEWARKAVTLYIVVVAVVLFFSVLAMALALVARRKLKEGSVSIGLHIVLLLGGLFSGDIFYLLGGIFGVVAANEDAQKL